MPTTTTLIAFSAVCLGMVLTPGPNMVYLISRSLFQVQALPYDPPRKLFAMGFLTNLLNPKVAMLYLSLFPQFIDTTRDDVLTQSLVLGGLHMCVSFAGNLTFALTAGALSVFLAKRPTWLLVQRWLMGLVLGGLAIRMAMESRR
jgi:threonine/homoserine/homoserine lactone efflux protein